MSFPLVTTAPRPIGPAPLSEAQTHGLRRCSPSKAVLSPGCRFVFSAARGYLFASDPQGQKEFPSIPKGIFGALRPYYFHPEQDSLSPL